MELLLRYTLTAALVFLFTVGVAAAQAGKGEKAERGAKSKVVSVSTNLKPIQRTAVLEHIKGMNRKPSALPAFKVPAQSVVLCGMQDGRFTCDSAPYGDERCPDKIDFKTPDGKMMNDIPVDCIGPDDEGNCECEFPKK